MVELHQSCGNLVISASTTCCGGDGNGIEEEEHEGKREVTTHHHHHVDVINDEISAELQREQQRNAELMERISMLEAQLRERDKYYSLQLPCGQIMKKGKAKRQKVATINSLKIEEDKDMTEDFHHDKHIPVEEINAENRLVNWMNIDDTELSLHSEILKSDSTTDDSTDEDDEEVVGENYICSNHDITKEADADCLLSSPRTRRDVVLCSQIPAEESLNPSTDVKRMCIERHEGSRNHHTRGHEIKFKRVVQNVSSHKMHPKIAFCPKEVKRIIDSKELLLKNAQCHTIRKIIVFASLGIRHGCEDLYELDFSHFAILRKGEPFVSSKDPGEHVLYENPGVRRKIFYPNHQNPTLCPVKILEEEKAMRPSDASCPSFLFLCIKYGGRTRNIPQNEYVRQRMGRNKLKSFGLAICRMAMLVHIRSGSFFFKALGITLLFMAGFPDDFVQRETKYRNLDLLQKYYRTDEDAEGEELFLSHSATADPDVIPTPQPEMVKKMSTKSKSRGRKKADIQDEEKASFLQSSPSSSELPPKFELLRNVSIQTRATAPAHCITSQEQANRFIPNPLITSINCNILNSNQQYPIFSPHSTSSFVPLIYWPPTSTFLPYPHPSSHTYPYPISGNYLSSYPQPYYSHPSCNALIPKPFKEYWKEDAAASVAGNDSKSICSSSTEPTKVEK